MCLARSSPTVLTWFMDASWSDLQHHHSGRLLPSGASTPSGPRRAHRRLLGAGLSGQDQALTLQWTLAGSHARADAWLVETTVNASEESGRLPVASGGSDDTW